MNKILNKFNSNTTANDFQKIMIDLRRCSCFHEQIKETFNWAYSTTKTTMDRMVKKGLLKRDDFHGVFLYQAQISKPAGLARLLSFFMNDLLEMDQSALVSLFGRSKALSESEIDELEGLLEQQTEQKEKSKM